MSVGLHPDGDVGEPLSGVVGLRPDGHGRRTREAPVGLKPDLKGSALILSSESNVDIACSSKRMGNAMKRMVGRVGATLVLLVVGAGASAQTCRDDIPATAPDSRFTDNGNGTVTDAATGLMWKQCAEGQSGVGCTSGSAVAFTWQQALVAAGAADFAGHTDWRLPNRNELESLVERRCYDPAINAGYFANTPSSWFWSSSPYAYYANDAWVVNFYGSAVGNDFKSSAYPVRLVRAGQ